MIDGNAFLSAGLNREGRTEHKNTIELENDLGMI